MTRSARRMRKYLLVVACIALVMGVAIGGTVAWLQDSTTEVVNTFSPADIDITLVETPNTDGDDEDTELDHWTAQLIPGTSYIKDPKVTVEANSVKCYLFVKVVETNKPSDYLEYTFKADGWTKLESASSSSEPVTTVYYRVVDESTSAQSWELLADNKVTVKDTVTTDTMPESGNTPSITFTAYAIR